MHGATMKIKKTNSEIKITSWPHEIISKKSPFLNCDLSSSCQVELLNNTSPSNMKHKERKTNFLLA